jgi:hypothetical protein
MNRSGPAAIGCHDAGRRRENGYRHQSRRNAVESRHHLGGNLARYFKRHLNVDLTGLTPKISAGSPSKLTAVPWQVV